LRTEVFGLEFAHEAGAWGVDHLELFCEGEMGMIGFTQRRVQTKPPDDGSRIPTLRNEVAY
jgi:hypothetical protein